MFTSALALNQVLSAASQHKNQKDKFTTVAAAQLGLSGSDAEPELIRQLFILVGKIKSDIDKLPLDEKDKRHARSFVQSFNGLESFSHIHMNIEQAKQHFLKPENLVGLTTLHMILSGHVARDDISADTKKLANEFRELRDKVAEIDLPQNVKDILIKRVIQISSILEHFYFFGPEALAEQLQGLVGAMVVNPPSEQKEAKKVYQRLAAAAGKAFWGLEKVDRGLGASIGVGDKAAKLLEAAQKFL